MAQPHFSFLIAPLVLDASITSSPASNYFTHVTICMMKYIFLPLHALALLTPPSLLASNSYILDHWRSSLDGLFVVDCSCCPSSYDMCALSCRVRSMTIQTFSAPGGWGRTLGARLVYAMSSGEHVQCSTGLNHGEFDIRSNDGQQTVRATAIRAKDQMIRIERNHTIVL